MAPSAPSDLALAAGARGQFIAVVPSQGLVMVRQGNSNDASLAPILLHDKIWQRLAHLGCTSANNEPNVAGTGFIVWPNPARQQIELNTTWPRPYTVLLYSDQGVLLQREVNASSLDLSARSAGTYFLVVRNAAGRLEQRRIIKQ
ncbi:MAG: T9SS type A sorting domain-containing protein [Lewinella sp.]|nr:T9SS type A sorting domain-containing protein [Lewinella sp.]